MPRFTKILKNKIPPFAFSRIHDFMDGIRLAHMTFRDWKRYRIYHSGTEYENMDQSGLCFWLLYYSHAIEKGLTHDPFRPGFGSDAFRGIDRIISSYLAQGYSQETFEFQVMKSTLYAYQERHISLNISTPLLDTLLKETGLSLENVSRMSGIKAVEQEPYSEHERNVPFGALVHARHSIRSFSTTPVNLDDIDEALRLAVKTPSVCNRQGTRLTILQDSETIQKVLQNQGGFIGFPSPPVLLVVTSDLRCFFGAPERNQCFIDGGLFAMTLLYALEDQKLATCMLSGMLLSKPDRYIRQLVCIPPYENIVCFIAVGNFPDDYSVTKSPRHNISEIRRFAHQPIKPPAIESDIS